MPGPSPRRAPSKKNGGGGGSSKPNSYLEADAWIETESSTLPVASASVMVAVAVSLIGKAAEEKRVHRESHGLAC